MNTRFGAFVVLLAALGRAAPAFADDEADAAAGTVPPATRRAVLEYLLAQGAQGTQGAKEKPALDKALAALRGDLAIAVAALRSHDPLAPDQKPGAKHGLPFTSGGKTWEYSILLPKGYDGRKRFPVLVLPDHGLVSPEAGIGFWEGKDGSDDYVIFRPVILKYQEDRSRFPEAQFLVRDAPIARVMADALAALRLRYAVDPDRFAMTGLSQAGFYTWYYAVSFPDQFAGIVPESAGGVAQRALVHNVARNLAGLSVRILHTEGDQVCPYADAVRMRDALKDLGGRVELITYTDADYPGQPFEKRHPGPHPLRLRNVLSWAKDQRRTIPTEFTRILRYPQHGFEGRFRLDPPKDPTKPLTVAFSEKDGVLSCDAPGAVYLVSPEDVLARKVFRVGSREVRPKADLRLLLGSFKATGDKGRMVAAEIPLGR